MKLMISLSGSPVLRHILPVSTASKVLKNNEFILSVSGGTEAELALSTMPYYLSTTRHNLGKYSVGKARANNVIFDLDGVALGHNHKIKPVDYWGEDFRIYGKGDYEAEDRILSKNPTIKNATKYIKSIRLYIRNAEGKKWEQRTDLDIKYYRTLIIQAKRLNIPVRLYNQPKDFLFDNKAKAIPITGLNLLGKTRVDLSEREQKSELKPYIELYTQTEWNYLSKEAKDLYSSITPYRMESNVSTLGNHIHTYRASTVQKIRKDVEALTNIMTKHKLTKEDFLRQIKSKW